MEIRRVSINDLDAFMGLYKLSYKGLEEYAYTKNRDIKHYFKWLMRRDEEGFFVAKIGEPVGFIACDTNWISFFDDREVGEIHELFVHPEWRGKGIGKKLLEIGIDYAMTKGRNLIELWVGTTNDAAKKFYEKNGFIEKGSWGKWVRMVKKI
ncbi:N-acetyltransferase [Archaeoglobales archaeon]|nr:MAG: N-acetyltransferase [Archaeoglobales archaeon]